MPWWWCGSVVRWPTRGTHCVVGLLVLALLCLPARSPRAADPPFAAAAGRILPAARAAGGVAVRRGGGVIFEVTKTGATVSGGSGVALRLGLSALGRGRALETVPPVSPAWRGNQVSYARAGVLERYSIGAQGLEQRFTLARRIAGSGILTLAVGSVPRGEFVQLGRGGTSLTLAAGARALSYGEPVATDAGRRKLPIRIRLAGARVLLQVDDSGARYPIAIDPLTQAATLDAADGEANDSFGSAAAAADGTIVVGAPGHADGANTQAGAAYVFSDASGSWQQTAELTAGDGATGDTFGAAVAVADGTIVVGAPGHADGADTQAGAAYVFSDASGSWQQTAELTAGDGATGDTFGAAVAVADGTIVVGAPGHAVGASTQAGAAYVFSDASGSWQQAAELNATGGAAGDMFGAAVGDSGSAIVVGAPGHAVGANTQAGSAYVFSDRTGRWRQTTALTAADGAAGDRLGASVQIAGSTVVAGAPGHAAGSNAQAGAAYVFDDNSGTWQQPAELTAGDGAAGDNLGTSVAIFGSTITAGAPEHAVGSDSQAGAAYVFSYASGGWQQSTEQTAGDAAANDAFGTSVAVSSDGIVAASPAHAVGYSGQGAAYVYALPVPVGAPASTAPPSISGTAVEGDTLTESAASWTDDPTSIGYQWEDCDGSGIVCSPILGATAQTYTLTGTDIGQTIVVEETASNADGAGTPASSAATAQVVESVPLSTSSPSVTGAAVEGATLTESHGSWTNNPSSYSYQWEDCDTYNICTSIVGATGEAYMLTSTDVGQTIVVQETATNSTGQQPRELGGDRTGRAGGSGEHIVAVDHGHRSRRRDRDGVTRVMDQQSHLVHVSMGGLRDHRLFADPRRRQSDVHPGRDGYREYDRRPGNRIERGGRRQPGELRGDRGCRG